MRIEEQILSNLIHNEEFCRKVIPFINTSYFSDFKERMIVEEITAFFNKYNKPISSDILTIELSNRSDVTDKQLSDVISSVEGLPTTEANQDWLIEHTEKFCKDKAVYNLSLIHI